MLCRADIEATCTCMHGCINHAGVGHSEVVESGEMCEATECFVSDFVRIIGC